MDIKEKEELVKGEYRFRVIINGINVTIQYDSQNESIDIYSLGYVGNEEADKAKEVEEFINYNRKEILAQLKKEIQK